MAKKKHSQFDETARLNIMTYDYYFARLMNIAVSVFEWKNLPDSIDERFLEMNMFVKGRVLFFKDEVMGFLALPCTLGGVLDVYNIPTERKAYASNGYQAYRKKDDSVVIFHNYLHTIPSTDINMFALRLADLQRTIDVNVHAQKTPVIVTCNENERLSMQNLMMQYDGNTPLIFADKGLNPNNIKAIEVPAPYVADRIHELKTEIWNDAMTYLGISNVNVTKKERLITDEVQRNMGVTLASRYSPLDMRKQACKEINNMFGLNVDVDYREDILAYESDIIGGADENIANSRGEENNE